MPNTTSRLLGFLFAICLSTLALSASANAGSLRQGSTGQSAQVTGSLPGQVLWTSYSITNPFDVTPAQVTEQDNNLIIGGHGDNILRLINPNGAANGNLAGAQTQTVCAMIYVFDEVQEMGECCGCPLSSSQLATFSIEKNLTSNWGIRVPSPVPLSVIIGGSIAIVAASPNDPLCLQGGGGEACHGGCDPTNVPGYSVTTASNLLGSMTHHDATLPAGRRARPQSFLTEVSLSDDAGGDPTNLTYLQAQCGALVGNGTGGGICNCPVE